MRNNFLVAIAGALAMAGSMPAQNLDRRAAITNRGGDRESCTVQVVVDGEAEISISGDHATLRNISGQTPQWRRFDCSSPLPQNPPDFRFRGVDGRGRQELVRAPGGGPAVIRISDPSGGAEAYTFEIAWGAPFRQQQQQPPPPPVVTRRFSGDQAVMTCRDEVFRQAADRFGTRDIDFRRINMDDNPGRNDWVIGQIDVRFRDGRREAYSFSCSVNFDNGRVRNVDIQRFEERRRPEDTTGRAIESCRRGVTDRIVNDGFNQPRVSSINVDDRPGRNDWVVGRATGLGRAGRTEYFEFSCSVDLGDGDLRSVDVTRRY
jgi:hypothetical protein